VSVSLLLPLIALLVLLALVGTVVLVVWLVRRSAPAQNLTDARQPDLE
jgi:flagellar basal body-associated protein FliL